MSHALDEYKCFAQHVERFGNVKVNFFVNVEGQSEGENHQHKIHKRVDYITKGLHCVYASR